LRDLVHHHYRLLDTYRLTQPLDCPVLAVEARDGAMHAHMQGFAAWTLDRFEHRLIAGDHYSMLDESNWATLRQWLQARGLRDTATVRGRVERERQPVLTA
jgi:surfactin synthase thioesterase subunit